LRMGSIGFNAAARQGERFSVSRIPGAADVKGAGWMKLIDVISLPNGLKAEIYDNSRAVARDMVKVVFIARVRVEVKEEYFDRRADYELTRRMFGEDVLFEQVNERTFVPLHDQSRVFGEFEDRFKNDALFYLSRPHFPGRFVLSKFRDIEKNPWKYGLLPERRTDGVDE